MPALAACTSYPLSLFNGLFIGGVCAYYARDYLLHRIDHRFVSSLLFTGVLVFAGIRRDRRLED